jgi:hypothetical protein
MTHRLVMAMAAVTVMAAASFANAQGTGTSPGATTATAPAQEPKIETLSTQHADPTAHRTVGESVKPQKNNNEDGDLAAAVRIDQQMSRESEGGYRRRHRRDW